MKNYILLLALIAFVNPIAAQKATSAPNKIWIIANYIKDDAKLNYEKWMTDIFFAPMKVTKDPVLAQQYQSTRWLKPARQNEDKTWTYAFLMDPLVPNGNYDIEAFLKNTYGAENAKAYLAQYEGFLASPPNFHVLNDNPITERNAEEEAIKNAIIGETTAWANGDLEADINSYSKSDWTEILHNQADLSYKLLKGFENIRKSLTESYQKNPGKQADPNTDRSNWSVKILSPEWAWATYNEKFTSPRGIALSGYNTRLMHKEEGKWRISALNGLFDFKNPIYPTLNPTEEDIKKVIADEGTAFSQGNIDGFMDTQADVPYLLWTVTNLGNAGDVLTFRGSKALKDWASSLPWFKAYKPDAPNLPTDKTVRDNWQFQIKGNIAIVNFDEHVVAGPDKSKVDATTIKIMERIGGKWKIINTAALADFKDATPPIRSKY